MAAARFAHAQVIDLRMDLTSNIVRTLWGDINRAWWSTMNQMDERTMAAINLAFDSAFDGPLRRWRNVESVRALLERACETLKDAAWVALNVPWPGEDTDDHVYAVRQNLEDLFDIKYFCKIRKAMLEATPSVLKIQREWRRVSTDPTHLTCRRRLLREFEALSKDLENMKP